MGGSKKPVSKKEIKGSSDNGDSEASRSDSGSPLNNENIILLLERQTSTLSEEADNWHQNQGELHNIF